MRYFYFPDVLDVDSEDHAQLLLFLEVARNGSKIPFITLETIHGLNSYTPA